VLEVKPEPVSGPARPDPQAGLSIAEAARRTGVSVHTLRYYERAGLVVTAVDRTAGGRRRYHQLDLDWIVICTRLRATGMPIRTIRCYAELVSAGPGNEQERLALLEAHRAEVTARLARTRENLKLIDHKIDVYRRRRRPPVGAQPPGGFPLSRSAASPPPRHDGFSASLRTTPATARMCRTGGMTWRRGQRHRRRPSTSTQTAPVGYRVFHSSLRPSAITMPVLAPGGGADEGPGYGARASAGTRPGTLRFLLEMGHHGHDVVYQVCQRGDPRDASGETFEDAPDLVPLRRRCCHLHPGGQCVLPDTPGILQRFLIKSEPVNKFVKGHQGIFRPWPCGVCSGMFISPG
jgi:DNA-binding transcriptional MerR regulator